ncbi:MAG TPA: hypothetical protein VKT72_15125 [Candidatus Baltobacteraceae bacterium]|nr:hypothetical protein [Candidatus Baltobacteraceae bacterium]
MRLVLSFAAAAAVLLTPLAAHAVTTHSRTVTYNTTMRQTSGPLPSGGVIGGTMRLTFSSGGIVNGTYRDKMQGGMLTVAGGLTGHDLWLSFGGRGRHQFRGKVQNNGIVAGTITNWRGPRVYDFTAVPAKS